MSHLKRLSDSIKFRTVSGNWDQFLKLHKFLEDSFPIVHQKLELVKINDYSLLYKWNADTKESILLLAHMDVVPANEDEWDIPPFSGEIRDGFIWGRGTLDDKSCVMAILESVERLLSEGFQPKQTVYIAFGFDEETKGYLGARKIAEYLLKQNVKIEAILDEGAAIISRFLPQIDVPLALVGLAEKGLASFDLIAQGDGGHSSSPKRNSPVERMAKAIERISSYKNEIHLTRPVEEFFKTCGGLMPSTSRFFLKNMKFFLPLIKKRIETVPSLNAMLRTTMCVTIVHAGMADNVIPDKVVATINTRIIPQETAEDVFKRLKELLKDLQIDVVKNDRWEVSDPVPCSDMKTEFFSKLSQTIKEVFPDSVVTPFLTIGGTDSRHYKHLCSNIYRFAPITMKGEEMNLVHGKNERISTQVYEKMIDFYYRLLKKE
ncbi:MAG: M20/M25/M40 family metallo-hydrolase [Pseudothermotoga sp.]